VTTAFTTPVELPATRDGRHWVVRTCDREVRLSNLDKVFWPEEGYTKGDLLAYYHSVAPYILPYLRDRPLTMKRMPDGATGPFFYEKNAPAHTPDWIERCLVKAEDASGGEISFLMAQDAAALLYVANLGCIEFHPLHSRCGSIDHPDYLFFDLDPFEPATFDDVRAVAHHVRAALDVLGLPSYPKTSGATGMQIYVPMLPGPTYETVREFVGRIGRMILATDRDRVTMEWDTSKRTGKVFIDHNMNRRGQNIAAVYSVRPEPGATVSTPLTWDEVEAGVHPSDFTIVTVHERLARVGDLFEPVLAHPVDVRPALERLGLRTDEDAAGSVTDSRRSLAVYVSKRDFSVTPEPAPAPAPLQGGRRFVIQKHDATRLHYDLRLERDGVLVSWAVPKGLPTETGVRHLAVQTEDHPLEYGSFEGWIPKGQYGGGEVRIFDEGTYEALEWEPDRKITFRLSGRRHRGEYHMVRTGQGWLVMLSKASEREQPPPAPELSPMLASPWPDPFDDDRWRFEPKLDGIRTLAYVTPESTRLVSRSGRDQTAIYPELNTLAQHVNALSAVLDGEIVAMDEAGRPSFEMLQQRMNLTSPADVDRIRRRVPVQMYAFDLLWLDGRVLTDRPLQDRRRELEAIVTEAGPLRLTLYRDGEGTALYDAAQRAGFEGVVAKRLGSPYLPGRRTADWRKVKANQRASVVILGWTRGTGSRSSTFGSLLVGAYERGELRWAGQVGTGFTQVRLAEMLAALEPLVIERPAVGDPALRKMKDAVWVRPELVCEVEFLQVTSAGKLRAPSFKGLRPDLVPIDCELPGRGG